MRYTALLNKEMKAGRMIYFDNAATTMKKPPEVVQAVVEALQSFGGVGRGVHGASLSAGMAVYEAREAVARLFGAPSAARVAFCSNATEALNIAIAGLVRPGERAVTTAASHNSVLRPLYRARAQGADVDILPVAPDASINYDALEALLERPTRLLVATHASNVTGDVYDIERMAHLAHAHGALLLVDAAQTAGVVPLDMGAMGLDLVAFTGHKSLFGPQGTGGLCVGEGVEVPPFKVGGSGIKSYDEEHPSTMPERLEAGTLNGHGIAGLAAGIAYLERAGLDAVAAQTHALVERFEAGARQIEGVRILGGRGDSGRCGIVALNVGDVDSAVVSAALNADFGICTRAGAHCAPLMHQALDTVEQGAVRFSFSHLNTMDEVEEGLRALSQVATAVLKDEARAGV